MPSYYKEILSDCTKTKYYKIFITVFSTYKKFEALFTKTT